MAVKTVRLSTMIRARQRDGNRALLPRPFFDAVHEERSNATSAPLLMDDESRDPSKLTIVLDGKMQKGPGETDNRFGMTRHDGQVVRTIHRAKAIPHLSRGRVVAECPDKFRELFRVIR